jgi:hypothetical protein
MKVWFFRFEGRFKSGDTQYGLQGVISCCFVPANTRTLARAAFLDALCKEGIDLVEIMECFEVHIEAFNSEHEQDKPWVDAYRETVRENRPMFDVWHVFDPEKEDAEEL